MEGSSFLHYEARQSVFGYLALTLLTIRDLFYGTTSCFGSYILIWMIELITIFFYEVLAILLVPFIDAYFTSIC